MPRDDIKLFGCTREELQKQFEDGDWSPPTDIVDILFDMAETVAGEFQ